MSQDITFRRIRGRIVPIKLNKQQKDAAIGATSILAGVGAAALSGNVTKRMLFKSAKTAMNFFETGKSSRLIVSKALGTISKSIKNPAIAIGASLVGYGSMKIAKSLKIDDQNAQIVGIGSTASAGIALKAFEAGMYGKAGFKPFAKAIPSKVLSLLKAVK